jgi:hypothetical protein
VAGRYRKGKAGRLHPGVMTRTTVTHLPTAVMMESKGRCACCALVAVEGGRCVYVVERCPGGGGILAVCERRRGPSGRSPLRSSVTRLPSLILRHPSPVIVIVSVGIIITVPVSITVTVTIPITTS